MMYKLSLLAFSLLIVIRVSAQKELAVKLYNQSTYSKVDDSYRSYYVNDTFSSVVVHGSTQILHPTIAINWVNRKNRARELELTHFNFKINEEHDQYRLGPVQYKSTLLHVALRYEVIYTLMKKNDTRIKAQLGVALMPFFKYQQYVPSDSYGYPSSEMKFGLKHYVIPRCRVRINPKWDAEINVPIVVAKAQFNRNVFANPTIPLSRQQYTLFDFDMLQREFQMRLGICYKL